MLNSNDSQQDEVQEVISIIKNETSPSRNVTEI